MASALTTSAFGAHTGHGTSLFAAKGASRREEANRHKQAPYRTTMLSWHE